MWKVVPGIALSLLPRRWRAAIPEETVPWVPAAILSGMLEAILAVGGLTYWYSRSVTTWAMDRLDSALRNGPAAEYDPHLLGLSAFVIWSLHPLTWLLASADWFYGKVTRRLRERGVADLPGGKEQLPSFLETARFAVKTVGLRELPDELTESIDGAESILEIRSSRQKTLWMPPRVVRVDDIYYRLESVREGRRPRPFVYRLRRLAAGVPGRNVILYHSPVVRDRSDAREPA